MSPTSMRAAVSVAALAFASCALFVSYLPAAAAKTTTGKLSKRGYTVIGLSGGTASSTQANKGSFRLRTGSGTLTLHLREPNGKYAGPIVVGRDGKRAIVGVEAGAELGRIDIRKGYARVTKRLREKWVDESRTARTRNRAPLGARAFGRVRASTPRRAPSADPDLDGVPNPFDIDDDGDLVLDNLERPRGARASQVRASSQVEEFGFEFNLEAVFSDTLNVNAGPVTIDDIDNLLVANARLLLGVSDPDVEIDCGKPQKRTDRTLRGLAYCTTGGTGRVVPPPTAQPPPPIENWTRFPDDCDPDEDGLGSFGGNCRDLIAPRARSDQIGSGDVLIARYHGGGPGNVIPASLPYVPVTTPALVSYSDGQGNSAKVSCPNPTPPDWCYPVAPSPPGYMCPPPGPPCGGPGTVTNPFPAQAGPNGDVVLTLTIWRPQRLRLSTDPDPGPGDSETWTDIGGLLYAYETGCISENDPNLVITEDPAPSGGEPSEEFGLTDTAGDAPSNPANKLTWTINVTECLATVVPGTDDTPDTWEVGEIKAVGTGGYDGIGGGGGVTIWFRRVG